MKTIESKILKIGHSAFTTRKKLIDTLFNPIDGKTASGFYNNRANGILFSKPCGNPWFFIVANKWGERFFVSCGQVNGRTVYMNSLSTKDEELLGIHALKYSQKGELAESIWNYFN